MVIYPAAILFLVIWVVISVRDADRGVTFVIATLPFGMFAFLDAGGLSLLVAHCLAVLTIGLYGLRRIGGRSPALVMPTASLYLLAFALYALVSAFLLVRLFAGSIMVFPMSVETDGLRISTYFMSSLKPLGPSSSNIAQSGYILLSALVFVVFLDIAYRRGTEIIERGLVWAATINICLAVLDMVGADQVLGLIRTADYSLAHQQKVFGLPRVIGGYAEASVFGPATAVLFAYFATSYLIGWKARDGLLALGSLFFTLVAYSTTGFVALGAAGLLILLHLRGVFGRGLPRAAAHWIVIGMAVLVLAFCVAAITTPLVQTAWGILNEQLFQKQASVSGIERSAWARAGFRTFVETWGLGAGVGSIRANGFAAVLLGSVGIPGTVLFLLFLWAAFSSSGLPAQADAVRVFVAARVAALTFMAGKLASGTTPDPELMLMTLAALAVATRLGAHVTSYTAMPSAVAVRA